MLLKEMALHSEKPLLANNLLDRGKALGSLPLSIMNLSVFLCPSFLLCLEDTVFLESPTHLTLSFIQILNSFQK